jgi:hypothetical protein
MQDLFFHWLRVGGGGFLGRKRVRRERWNSESQFEVA